MFVTVDATKGQLMGGKRGDQVMVLVPASAVHNDDAANAEAAKDAQAKAAAVAAMPEESITVPAGIDARTRAEVNRLKALIARSQPKADTAPKPSPAVKVK